MLRPSVLIKTLARTRPSGDSAEPAVATTITLKRLAKRHQYLTAEIQDCDAELARLVRENAPTLLDVTGVGNAVASRLLVTIGDNSDRFTSEAQFAALTGVAPIPASSGKTTRHRLFRAGDRAANAVIHRHCPGTHVRGPVHETFRVLRNPRHSPLTNDARPRRLALTITLTAAAQHLGLWPSGVTRIEQGKNRNHDLTIQCRDRLNNQLASAAWHTIGATGPGIISVGVPCLVPGPGTSSHVTPWSRHFTLGAAAFRSTGSIPRSSAHHRHHRHPRRPSP